MLKIKSFVFNPLQENTYILYNEKKHCIIIDPGCYFDEEKDTLLSYISQTGLQPQMLLNTHCHLDHVFGNKFVAETFELPLHIHANEKKLLDYAPASGLMYNLPFDNYAGEIKYLANDEEIKLDQDRLKALFTPGHSPGHLSFYNAENNFAVSGDALFYESIGRTDLPGGNFDTLIESIKTNLYSLPAETAIYSGHGPSTTVGHEIANNPFTQ